MARIDILPSGVPRPPVSAALIDIACSYLFDNVVTVLGHGLEAWYVWNKDETCVMTVQTPEKIIATKSSRWVP